MVLLSVIAHYRGIAIPKVFPGDAGLAGPNVLRFLKQEGFRYPIRVKGNALLGVGGDAYQGM